MKKYPCTCRSPLSQCILGSDVKWSQRFLVPVYFPHSEINMPSVQPFQFEPKCNVSEENNTAPNSLQNNHVVLDYNTFSKVDMMHWKLLATTNLWQLVFVLFTQVIQLMFRRSYMADTTAHKHSRQRSSVVSTVSGK